MKKEKKSYMYIHTINGFPARYEKENEQICFADKYFVAKLVPSYSQIRKEQALSGKYRKSQHFSIPNYGHIRVEMPFKPCKCKIKSKEK